MCTDVYCSDATAVLIQFRKYVTELAGNGAVLGQDIVSVCTGASLQYRKWLALGMRHCTCAVAHNNGNVPVACH